MKAQGTRHKDQSRSKVKAPKAKKVRKGRKEKKGAKD